MIDQTPIGVMVAGTMESIERNLAGHDENAIVIDALLVAAVAFGENREHYYSDVGCTNSAFHVKIGLLQSGLIAVTATTPLRPGGPASHDDQ